MVFGGEVWLLGSRDPARRTGPTGCPELPACEAGSGWNPRREFLSTEVLSSGRLENNLQLRCRVSG